MNHFNIMYPTGELFPKIFFCSQICIISTGQNNRSFHFILQMKPLASPILTDNLVAAFNSRFNVQIEIHEKYFLFRIIIIISHLSMEHIQVLFLEALLVCIKGL